MHPQFSDYLKCGLLQTVYWMKLILKFKLKCKRVMIRVASRINGLYLILVRCDAERQGEHTGVVNSYYRC